MTKTSIASVRNYSVVISRSSPSKCFQTPTNATMLDYWRSDTWQAERGFMSEGKGRVVTSDQKMKNQLKIPAVLVQETDRFLLMTAVLGHYGSGPTTSIWSFPA